MSQPAAQPASGSSASAAADVVDALAVELVALYAAAEQQLLGEETRLVRSAVNAQGPDLLRRMRNVAQVIAAKLHLRAQPLAWQMAQLAAEHGERVAFGQLQRLVAGDRRFAFTPHSQSAVNAIAIDLADKLGAVEWRITRFADDAYRTITASAAVQLVRSDLTPAQAQAFAWRKLTERGVIGFVDRRGGQWNLATYVEMAVRTAGQRAFNASHLARLTALGVEQFTINHDGHPCPLCLPFEGRVLANEAGPGVYATLDEATAAGLFHPNCRHVLLPYFAGITELGRAGDWTPADERRYRATQRLRALERQVRAAKYQQAAALTPLDAKRAARNVRAAQAAIRVHLEQNDDLVRRPRREQLDLGNR